MLLNGRREFLPSLTRSVALGSKASEHGFDSRRGASTLSFHKRWGNLQGLEMLGSACSDVIS